MYDLILVFIDVAVSSFVNFNAPVDSDNVLIIFFVSSASLSKNFKTDLICFFIETNAWTITYHNIFCLESLLPFQL